MMKEQTRKIVEAILINKNNEVLLQKKTLDYKFEPKGGWCFFGGQIENGETPEQAIRREINEEINYTIKDFTLFKTMDYKEHNIPTRSHIFLIPFHEDISRISLHEGAGFALFDRSELHTIRLFNHVYEVLEDYFNQS